jgi:hypothetical protein
MSIFSLFFIIKNKFSSNLQIFNNLTLYQQHKNCKIAWYNNKIKQHMLGANAGKQQS